MISCKIRLIYLGSCKITGSADNSSSKNASKPICEECGLGCYSVLVAKGITGNS
jgi:hypothetical protein